MDMDALAQAIADISAFTAVAGADYVEVYDPEGTMLDNIVYENDAYVWGLRDELSSYDNPKITARAVVWSLKDYA